MEFETQTILGHNKNFLKLTKLIKKNRLPNSLVFQGTKGIGKTSAAYRIAQFIFEQNDSPIDKYEFKKLLILVFISLSILCFTMVLNSSLWILIGIIFGLRFFGQGMLFHLPSVAIGRWFCLLYTSDAADE